MGQNMHDWVVRGRNSSFTETDITNRSTQEAAPTMLVAADMHGSNGYTDCTYLVLTQLCSCFCGLGIEMGSAESCACVEGSVQMLSTQVPTVSSIGALRQFTLLFPNIMLQFT